MGSPDLQEHVEQFAQDKDEFHKVFRSAFIKLCDVGHDADGLSHIEHFVEDDPNFKLSYPEFRTDWVNNIQ